MPFYTKTPDHLPRQARVKHRNSRDQRRFLFLQAGAVLVDVELWADGEMEAMFPDGLDELRSHYKTTLGYQFVRDIAGYLATRVRKLQCLEPL